MHDTTKEGMRAIAKARIEAAAKPRKGGVGSVFARASAKAGIDRKDGALSIAIAAPGDNVIEFDPDTLQRSPTNREWFDEVKAAELAESVKIHGVLQPGIVRPLKQPIGKITHEIVMGERRWRAAKKAKRKFPAKIRELTDLEALELQAVENFQREDLNPIDEAAKFQQLRDAYEGAGATKTAALDMICERTGKASSTIAQRLALLKLPSEIVTLTQRGALPPSHATALGKVKDPATVASLAAQIMHPKDGKDEEGVMPIRQAEQLVKAAVQRENNLTAWQKEETEFKA
jgi:ParB family chromosome partitioning protein